jgi:hypothetical protein
MSTEVIPLPNQHSLSSPSIPFGFEECSLNVAMLRNEEKFKGF